MSDELDDNIEAAGRQCINPNDPVDAAFDRLDHALDRAAHCGFDDFPKSRRARNATAERPEPRRPAPSPTPSSGSPRDLVLEMMPVGRSELRENVTRALTQKHRHPPSTASMAIKRLIDADKLKETEVGKHKVLERIA